MAETTDLHRIPAHKLAELGAIGPRLQRLADAVGMRPLAALLDISHGDLSRMVAGQRPVPQDIGKRILDLDHLFARAIQVFGDGKVVIDWLDGIEPTFGYGPPIAMLAKRGAAPLLDVLERIESGADS